MDCLAVLGSKASVGFLSLSLISAISLIRSLFWKGKSFVNRDDFGFVRLCDRDKSLRSTSFGTTPFSLSSVSRASCVLFNMGYAHFVETDCDQHSGSRKNNFRSIVIVVATALCGSLVLYSAASPFTTPITALLGLSDSFAGTETDTCPQFNALYPKGHKTLLTTLNTLYDCDGAQSRMVDWVSIHTIFRIAEERPTHAFTVEWSYSSQVK